MSGVLEGLNHRAEDAFFLLRGERASSDSPIILVFIDDASAMNYGFRSPTPRLMLAELIDELNRKGAAVIGLDVLLDRKYLQHDDAVLKEALIRAGHKLVLVNKLVKEGGAGKGTLSETGSIHPYFLGTNHNGFAELKIGVDDTVRWIRVGGIEQHKSFSEVIFEVFQGNLEKNDFSNIIPTTQNWMRLDYYGTPSRLSDPETYFPIYAVSEIQYLPADLIKNKIIMIGSAIEDLGDVFQTPFSTKSNHYRSSFGVEIQAVALDMMLTKRVINEASTFVVFLIIAFLLFFAGLLFLTENIYLNYGSLLILSFFALIVPPVIFLLFNLIVPFSQPFIGLILVFILCNFQKGRMIELVVRRLKTSFESSRNELRVSKNKVQELESSRFVEVEKERGRIARELHDDLGQNLTALKFDLDFVLKQISHDQGGLKQRADSMKSLIGRSMQSMRQIISDLNPSLLEELGLIEALKWLVAEFENRSGIFCEMTIEDEKTNLKRENALVVFRVFQEILNNILKHSGANRVRIMMTKREHQFVLVVSDNGKGLDKRDKKRKGSFGLSGMENRARATNGKLVVRGLKDIGTSVKLSVPVDA
ncbi:CHASE2 domain-containing protein [bacterium]|nr:CHASE2 domain-containing protein [bacterium]